MAALARRWTLLVGALVAACPAPEEACVAPEDPLVFAYRGGEAAAPENTVAAVRAAIAAGSDGVEVDVRLSADGVIIAFHDPTTGRTSDDPDDRPIASLTYAELQELDVGAWFGPEYVGTRIPTLAFTGPKGVARLNDLTLDARGYIYFAGFSDVANGGQMLVGRLHP